MKHLFLCLLVSIPLANLYACLNGERITLQTGTPLYFDYSGSIPRGHSFISRSDLLSELKEHDILYKKTRNLDYLSDKGLILIILGEYNRAVALYEEIEKIEPGRYSTASNMGTAYELLGKNELALKWIQRAVAIDPASHHGSEWIHVNILKFKLSGAQPATSMALIGSDFGAAPRPQTSLSAEHLQKLANALFYQLNERVSFIEPKDDIIARLFFDYANVNMLLNDNATARSCYEDAITYGFNGELAATRYRMAVQRVKELDSIIIHTEMTKLGYKMGAPPAEEKQGWHKPAWGGGLAVVAAVAGSVLYRRKRKKTRG